MIATAVLNAQYANTAELLDTVRIDARSTLPAPVVSSPRLEKVVIAMDASTIALARLRGTDRHWDYTLSYSPSVTATDVELGVPLDDVLPFQAGTVAVGWHDRFVHIAASEAVSFGLVNSAILSTPAASIETPSSESQTMTGQTTQTTSGSTSSAQSATSSSGAASGQVPPVASLPAPKVLESLSSSTAASVAVNPTRRTSFFLSAGYYVAGGLTHEAQAALPEQYGPVLYAGAAENVTRQDNVSIGVSLQDTLSYGLCPPPTAGGPAELATNATTYCRNYVPIAQLLPTLHHQTSPTGSVTAVLGIAGLLQRTPTPPGQSPALVEAVVQPVGSLTYSDRIGERGATTLTATAQLAPTVDIRTGIPNNRIQATVAVTDRMTSILTWAATAAALKSLPFPTADLYPLILLTGSIEARIHVERWLDVAIGDMELWQTQTSYGTFASSVGYVSVTAHTTPLHF